MEGKRIGRLSLLCAAVVTVLAVPPASAAEPEPCRVRNVTQETFGRSFTRMVGRAVDGDQLRVRGTCAAGVSVFTDLDITGVGDRATLTGFLRSRVLEVRRRADVTLRDLRIVGGRPPRLARGGGAGILNRGSLTMVDSVVARNRVGAGIINWENGRLTLIRSVVRRNTDGGLIALNDVTLVDSVVAHNRGIDGGGIYADSFATVTLLGTTVRDNRAQRGGGILNGFDPGGSTVTLGEGTVVTRNRADGRGGGVFNAAALTLQGGAIVSNTADKKGGGIFNQFGTVALDATSSVSGNTPDDCFPASAC